MDRKTQWLCLIAGGGLLALGMKRIYDGEGWTLLVLSALIVAFSLSSMLRHRNGK